MNGNGVVIPGIFEPFLKNDLISRKVEPLFCNVLYSLNIIMYGEFDKLFKNVI